MISLSEIRRYGVIAFGRCTSLNDCCAERVLASAACFRRVDIGQEQKFIASSESRK